MENEQDISAGNLNTVDTLAIMKKVTDELTSRGYQCTLEYPGFIQVRKYNLIFDWGTVNDTWGADVEDYDKCGVLNTDISSDSADVTLIVEAIVNGVESCRPSLNYKEFDDIAIPEFLKDWEDTSWHNDAMAHSTLFLTAAGADGATVEFWVNYKAPEDREFGTRYEVVFQKSFDVESGHDVVLYSGEDEAVAKLFAEAAEMAKTIIAQIETVKYVTNSQGKICDLREARSMVELHEMCDANTLGRQEQALVDAGWTGEDDEKDAAALHAVTDINNNAQAITDLWLRTRPAVAF